MQITAELRNWKKATYLNGDIYWGNVYNDTKGRFRNGARIHTSLVTGYSPDLNDEETTFVHTLNSVYLIRKDQEYRPPVEGLSEAQGAPYRG